MSPAVSLLFPAGWTSQRVETTGYVSTTALVNSQRRWCSLKWLLMVRVVQAEAKMSGRTWPRQRACWSINWRTLRWVRGEKQRPIASAASMIPLQRTLELSDVILFNVSALTSISSCLLFILFQTRMDSVYQHLERSRQVLTVLRALEARDRYLLEDNLWQVSFWSCLNLLVMLTVAVTQIYTLQRLFDDTKRVCT